MFARIQKLFAPEGAPESGAAAPGTGLPGVGGDAPPAGGNNNAPPASGGANAGGLPGVGDGGGGQNSAGLPGLDAGGAPKGNTPSAPAGGLRLPDGLDKDAPDLAKDLMAAAGDPQKVLDAFLAQQQRYVTSSEEKWAQQKQEWVESLKRDPDYGRDLKASDDAVNRALRAYDKGGRLTEWMKKMDYTTHLELRLFLRNIGMATREDRVAGLTDAGPPNGAQKTEEQLLEEFFNHPGSREIAQGRVKA